MSRLVDLIAALDEAPRTKAELMALCGTTANTVRAHIEALKSRGLVKPDGWRYAPNSTTNPAVIWRLWK